MNGLLRLQDFYSYISMANITKKVVCEPTYPTCHIMISNGHVQMLKYLTSVPNDTMSQLASLKQVSDTLSV